MKTSTDYLNALKIRVKLLHQSFSLWKTLVNIPNENEATYDRFANCYPKLHGTLYTALEYHMIVGLHAILVKRSKGVTITKLLNKIESEGVKTLKGGEKVEDLIQAIDVDLSKLDTLRDKFFAHQDAILLDGPFVFDVNEYDSLLMAATKVLDALCFHLTGEFIHALHAKKTVESQFLKLLENGVSVQLSDKL